MIFFKNSIDARDERIVSFEALEDNVTKGSCVLFLSGDKVTIKEIEFNEDESYIAEGLIRSAFNFAAMRNYYMGYLECGNKYGCLEHFNLNKNGDVYFNDIPTILRGNCCKNL